MLRFNKARLPKTPMQNLTTPNLTNSANSHLFTSSTLSFILDKILILDTYLKYSTRAYTTYETNTYDTHSYILFQIEKVSQNNRLYKITCKIVIYQSEITNHLPIDSGRLVSFLDPEWSIFYKSNCRNDPQRGLGRHWP